MWHDQTDLVPAWVSLGLTLFIMSIVKDVVGFLPQSLYVRHQIHARQTLVAAMTQYAKAIALTP